MAFAYLLILCVTCSSSLQVEKDYTVYGDECKFGGGKVLREGMGQAGGLPSASCLDLVITNALVVDYTGIYKVRPLSASPTVPYCGLLPF